MQGMKQMTQMNLEQMNQMQGNSQMQPGGRMGPMVGLDTSMGNNMLAGIPEE